MRIVALVWRLGLAGLVACGCAPEDRPVHPQTLVPVRRPITNGELDTDPAHQGVVALAIGHTLCSGSLIAPRVVLTAGHCAYERTPEDFTVMIGTDINDLQTFELGVVDVLVRDDYDPGTEVLPPFNDLALLLLDDSPPAGVTPLRHLPANQGITDSDVGWPLEFVGFGQTEDGLTGQRMSVINALGWVCTTAGGCLIGPARAVQYSICQDQRPGGPCSGDSGGPALVMRHGQEYVAGVTSYGDEDCLFFGCSVKVDAYQAWIDDFVSGQIGSSCAAPEDCRSGYCADGVCCDAACAGACLGCATPGAVGECVVLGDGVRCPDGLVCNGEETCQSGVCAPAAPPDCDDGDDCTVDACQEGTGCVSQTLADGSPCPDDDVCDGANACQAGVCTRGAAPDCDDGDPCTEVGCDPLSGCFAEPMPEGSQCGYGPCGLAQCISGECLLSNPPECDDGDPCTIDRCDPRVGCAAERKADGARCGKCRICYSGRCQAEPGCDPGGCGCSAGGRSGPWGVVLMMVLVMMAGGWLGRERRRVGEQ